MQINPSILVPTKNTEQVAGRCITAAMKVRAKDVEANTTARPWYRSPWLFMMEEFAFGAH